VSPANYLLRTCMTVRLTSFGLSPNCRVFRHADVHWLSLYSEVRALRIEWTDHITLWVICSWDTSPPIFKMAESGWIVWIFIWKSEQFFWYGPLASSSLWFAIVGSDHQSKKNGGLNHWIMVKVSSRFLKIHLSLLENSSGVSVCEE